MAERPSLAMLGKKNNNSNNNVSEPHLHNSEMQYNGILPKNNTIPFFKNLKCIFYILAFFRFIMNYFGMFISPQVQQDPDHSPSKG